MGSGRLQLTENGPGAINLPTSLEQLDSWTTRATHPKTLAQFSSLASLALNREVSIVNTGLPYTKGQLALVLKDSRFEEAARLTVSCERFPYVNFDSPCGRCTSCLYREAALYRVGMGQIDSLRNVQNGDAGKQSLSSSGSIGATALALHISRLDALLASRDPYRALDAEFPRIDEVRIVAPDLGMSDEAIQQMLVALYQEFSKEIGAILKTKVLALPRRPVRAIAS